MRTRPDTLVLGAGGVLGATWMTGLLAGMEDSAGIVFNQCEHFLGTSAGAIVAARLSLGRPLRRPEGGEVRVRRADTQAARPPDPGPTDRDHRNMPQAGRAARRAGAFAGAMTAPIVPIAFRLATPGASLARATALRFAPRPPDSIERVLTAPELARARFDGRLRIAAVDRTSGRRVVFGRPGAPAATVAEAVAASCAVPWLFAPVHIGDRDYVDGGVWSPTNVDAAPAGPGTRVLCLNPTGSLAVARPLLTLAGHSSRTVALIESQALRARGASVVQITPDREASAAIGADLMDDARRGAVLRAAYRQGLSVTAH